MLQQRDATFSLDAFVQQLQGSNGSYVINGLNQTLGGKQENIDPNFSGLVQRAYKQDGIVFACMLARMMLFKQARFQWQRIRNGQPGDLFGTPDLDILEHPWPNGSTSDLLKMMIVYADTAGNSFVTRRSDQLVCLRPDWFTMIFGSMADPNVGMADIDSKFLGGLYHPGGRGSTNPPVPLLASEIAHFAPIPDPLYRGRGMSWMTPIVREIMGDQAATEHKLSFFENGATMNLVVNVNQPDPVKFKEWIAAFEDHHRGAANAYRTLYLGSGSTATPIGADLQQADFKVTQGAGETRIAAAAGVPPSVVGISEGLAGSALNEGNFQAAMRRFGDLFAVPYWQDVCGSLQTIVPAPGGARLWYDSSQIPALRIDRTDAATIQQTKAQTIRTLVDSGFNAESVIKAVDSEDMTLLVHTGLFSVQLQAPGSTKMPAGEVPGESPVGPGTKPATIPAGDTSTKPLTDTPTKATNGTTPVAAKAGRALELLLSERSHDDN